MSQDCIYDGVFLMLIGRGIRIPSVTVDPHDQFSRDWFSGSTHAHFEPFRSNHRGKILNYCVVCLNYLTIITIMPMKKTGRFPDEKYKIICIRFLSIKYFIFYFSYKLYSPSSNSGILYIDFSLALVLLLFIWIEDWKGKILERLSNFFYLVKKS